MGRLKKGIFGAVVGKIGNVVTYELNGQNVIRTIGENKTPPTAKQLNNKLQMKLIMGFFEGMDVLIETGFNPKAHGTSMNFHNMAIYHNKPNALKGFYPDTAIDFSKIIISIGDLPQPVNPLVIRVETGLKFSWDVEGLTWPGNTDQVMLLAYAPAIEKYQFINSGARRAEGQAVLELNEEMISQLLEVYISFVSDDRKSVADSLYLGQVIVG